MAQTYNFTVGQGEDWSLTFNIKDDSGVLMDLTGYSFAGQVRDAYDSSNVIADFNFNIQNQLTNKGSVDVYLTHQQTSSIVLPVSTGANKRPQSQFVYDMKEIDYAGRVTRILEGTVTVTSSVTK